MLCQANKVLWLCILYAMENSQLYRLPSCTLGVVAIGRGEMISSRRIAIACPQDNILICCSAFKWLNNNVTFLHNKVTTFIMTKSYWSNKWLKWDSDFRLWSETTWLVLGVDHLKKISETLSETIWLEIRDIRWCLKPSASDWSWWSETICQKITYHVRVWDHLAEAWSCWDCLRLSDRYLDLMGCTETIYLEMKYHVMVWDHLFVSDVNVMVWDQLLGNCDWLICNKITSCQYDKREGG